MGVDFLLIDEIKMYWLEFKYKLNSWIKVQTYVQINTASFPIGLIYVRSICQFTQLPDAGTNKLFSYQKCLKINGFFLCDNKNKQKIFLGKII